MDDRLDLGGLFLHFLVLWFVAIGGPSTILPDIHRYVVEVHHLLTNAQFAEIYTLAQVAPGPNVMYVTLMGWHLAGWKGAAATTIPLLVPATTLTLLVGHYNERYPNAPIGRAIRRGLTPITIGLMFASATILMRGEPRLARVPPHAAHCGAGPAQAVEPAVAARRRCAGRHARARLSIPGTPRHLLAH
jgi:chromate transporter